MFDRIPHMLDEMVQDMTPAMAKQVWRYIARLHAEIIKSGADQTKLLTWIGAVVQHANEIEDGFSIPHGMSRDIIVLLTFADFCRGDTGWVVHGIAVSSRILMAFPEVVMTCSTTN